MDRSVDAGRNTGTGSGDDGQRRPEPTAGAVSESSAAPCDDGLPSARRACSVPPRAADGARSRSASASESATDGQATGRASEGSSGPLVSRRAVLAALASPGLATGVGGLATGTTTVSVGLYVTSYGISRADAATINAVADVVQSALAAAVPHAEPRVGPAGIVSVPRDRVRDSHELLSWWRGRGEYDDGNLLLCAGSATESWEHGGLAAIDGTAAVARHAEHMDRRPMQHLALHEVGHNLGLRHDHGRRRRDGETTYVSPMVSTENPNVVRELSFCDAAVDTLRAAFR